MKQITFKLLCFSCIYNNEQQIQSPSKEIIVDFLLTSQGEPTYKVSYKGKEVITTKTQSHSSRRNSDKFYANCQIDHLCIATLASPQKQALRPLRLDLTAKAQRRPQSSKGKKI